MSTTTEVPQVGGRWSGFGTSCVVARVDPHGAGGFRWLPLCDVSTDERLNRLRMLTAGLVPEFRASLPDDRQCTDCQKAGSALDLAYGPGSRAEGTERGESR